jgi:hypothetical protein
MSLKMIESPKEIMFRINPEQQNPKIKPKYIPSSSSDNMLFLRKGSHRSSPKEFLAQRFFFLISIVIKFKTHTFL